jgi:hypothetical protein
MNYKKQLVYIIIGVAGFLTCSCLDIHYYKGKTILGSITDTTMNGYSIITGRVYHIEDGNYKFYTLFPDEIWMENARDSTTTDSIGNYKLIVSQGTYTLKCHQKGNIWDLLVEEKRNVIIAANKKVQLDFYLGYRVE